jgi:hypothetical protein
VRSSWAVFCALFLSQAALAAPAPRAPLSDLDKIRLSGEGLAAMRVALRGVFTQLEEARESKDVVKLSCVNEKLTQMRGLVRISEQADGALKRALEKKQAAQADHELAKVTLAQRKTEQLQADAQGCAGQLAFQVEGNVSVEVQSASELNGSDPTRPPPPETVLSRPPAASPTL